VIKTDQISLKYLLEQKLTHALQHKGLSKLMGLQYEILYKKGIENKVADALSRRVDVVPTSEACEVTELLPSWLQELQASYKNDDWANSILQGLKETVLNWVKECHICQLNKGEHIASPELLQPIPVPDGPWSVISVDFICGLPKSDGKDVLLVVVDKFTKYCHAIPLSHPFQAKEVA
jgi:hypothetical protein